jgi:hypothetical protein
VLNSENLARLDGDVIAYLSWILWKNNPNFGQTLRERNLTLSQWIKSIRKLLKSRIHQLAGDLRTIYYCVFKTTEVVNSLCRQHENLVLVRTDTLYLYVKVIIINVFKMNRNSPQLLGILLRLESILQRVKFFKTLFSSFQCV